jgi:hypothetical protein
VIDVPDDGSYTFGVDSDDGTIGTLQDLSRGLEEVQVLWYGWNVRAMAGRLDGVEDLPLAAGTYLLTVHYFQAEGEAGYHLRSVREPRPPSPGPRK